MVPLIVRLPIILASLLAPRKERQSWKREWYAELSYRKRCGASLAYLLRSAKGAFRDAIWVRAQTPYNLHFLRTPLRAECLALGIALAICIWNSALIPPRPHYANLDRLVRLEHDLHFAGISDKYLWSPLLKKWAATSSVQRVAAYRVHVGAYRYARVTPNFFETLGVPPPPRLLPGFDSDPKMAIVTDEFWRRKLHSSANAVGTTFSAGPRKFEVAGILRPGFVFDQCSFFAPLGADGGSNALALLKPGASRLSAERDLQKQARAILPRWRFDEVHVRSLISRVSVASLAILGACVTLGLAYFLLKWRKMKAYVCARIAFGLLCVTAINLATFRMINHLFMPLSVLQFWTYLGMCAAAIYFVLLDQRSRCPTCLLRLQMPVSIGSWSSLILDRPATEYVCPAGHGVLFVSEALHDPDHWTVFDESWHDLFTEPSAH